MRRPRIYSTELLNHVGQLVALDENGSKHLVQVLRLKSDAEIILFDQRGEEFLATLNVADKKASQATLVEHLRSEAPAACRSHSQWVFPEAREWTSASKKRLSLV